MVIESCFPLKRSPFHANSRLWFVFCACLIPFSLHAGGLSFEPNLGQTGSEIRYLARTSNGVIFITDRGITLNGPPKPQPARQFRISLDKTCSPTPESSN